MLELFSQILQIGQKSQQGAAESHCPPATGSMKVCNMQFSAQCIIIPFKIYFCFDGKNMSRTCEVNILYFVCVCVVLQGLIFYGFGFPF